MNTDLDVTAHFKFHRTTLLPLQMFFLISQSNLQMPQATYNLMTLASVEFVVCEQVTEECCISYVTFAEFVFFAYSVKL